jgi:hypothetical protein
LQQTKKPINDEVAIILDNSASQQYSGKLKRSEDVLESLRERIAEIPSLTARVYSLSEFQNSDDELSGDQSTRLLPALRKILSNLDEDRLSGVIFLSDGQVSDSEETTGSELAQNINKHINKPFSVALSGNDSDLDAWITLNNYSKYGKVGSNAQITFTPHYSDNNGAGINNISGVVDVLDDAGNVVESRQVSYGKQVQITLPITKPRLNRYLLALRPVSGELSRINNMLPIELNGIRERMKVLLVTGKIYQGQRLWRNFLKSDPSIDLVHFNILRDVSDNPSAPEYELSLIPFPIFELFGEGIHKFDLIILDQYQGNFQIPEIYLNQVASYVTQGGSLLYVAGDSPDATMAIENSEFQSVLPIVPRGESILRSFKVKPSGLGISHPVTGNFAPNLGSSASWQRAEKVGSIKKNAQILLEDETANPILAMAEFGKGRSATLLSDQLWIWSVNHQGGGPFQQLARNIIHWLLREPDLEPGQIQASITNNQLTVSKDNPYHLDDEILNITPLFKTQNNEQSKALQLVKSEGDKPSKLAAKITIEPDNAYIISSGEISKLVIPDIAGEQEVQNLLDDENSLEHLTEKTGGIIRQFSAGDNNNIAYGKNMYSANKIPLLKNNAEALINSRESSVFGGLPLFMAGIILLCLSWLFESRYAKRT